MRTRSGTHPDRSKHATHERRGETGPVNIGRAQLNSIRQPETDLVDMVSHPAQERLDVLDRLGNDKPSLVEPEADPQVD